MFFPPNCSTGVNHVKTAISVRSNSDFIQLYIILTNSEGLTNYISANKNKDRKNYLKRVDIYLFTGEISLQACLLERYLHYTLLDCTCIYPFSTSLSAVLSLSFSLIPFFVLRLLFFFSPFNQIHLHIPIALA